MLIRSLVAAVLCLGLAAHAEDEAQRRAREELEKQLQQMVGKQPTKVRVDFESLDEPMYKLEEASFELDGKTLPRPALDELTKEGVHLVWNGDVTPGKHVVTARIVYANQASVVVSDEGGYAWKLSPSVSFDVHSGIEVRVKVTPQRDNSQKEIAKRFVIRMPATPVMLAQMDDGKMPEPPKKPEVVDAGAPVVVATAAELAAAEKKAKAEAAAEAKRVAAEEKKRKAEEAKEAKRLAAEEKKRKADEAKEAKRLAAEEKKREAEAKRLGVKLAVGLPTSGQTVALGEAGPVDAGPAEDAGAPLAEVIDAGPPLVAEVIDAGAPAPIAAAPPPDEAGPPWAIIGGVVGALALVLLIVLARRRSRPPTVDD